MSQLSRKSTVEATLDAIIAEINRTSDEIRVDFPAPPYTTVAVPHGLDVVPTSCYVVIHPQSGNGSRVIPAGTWDNKYIYLQCPDVATFYIRIRR